jgi:hypothetical protein
MTQQEFEALIGKEVKTETFNTVVNPMYMATNLDKQAFANDVKKHGLIDSTVAQELTEAVEKQKEVIESQRILIKSTVYFLLSRGEAGCDKQAIKLVGHKEVITIKMQQNFELNDDDRAYIINLLR